jgi:hypothetical protein
MAGFSFSGEVREPFSAVIQALEETKLPVTSVDAPSSWSIEDGPPASGVGSKFNPAVLISLTAPKPLVKHFKGRHFIGGRFVPHLAEVVSPVSLRTSTKLSGTQLGSLHQVLRRSTTSRFHNMTGLTKSWRSGQAARNSKFEAVPESKIQQSASFGFGSYRT